ncbi:Bax inhibitor-1/YccA family protein [Actinomycetospora cinnamomea]|uniref:Putative YccA/Bax inhibitor family protein n=1 Tax=Actinomycetospora cinnamomea TaxID=663609 RepID=A0A2U1EWC9_9PSEU|nr:Bax inhibitor-1/YccA family protein [Actinomycetospora cinnamomea]PVZ04228.1 putative YccA/Bax inhibitor family protein [Actinomycetospora cinnamomea]
MRTSSNPAFRNLPTSPGGYARFGDAPAGMAGAGGMFGGGGTPPATSATDDRPLTVDDVVQKTAINIALALVAGVLTAWSGFLALGLVGFVVGLVLALVIIFKQSTNKWLVLGYSAAEGMALGAITALFQGLATSPGGSSFAGIGAQAVLATLGVFIGMLVVYKTGAIRVTPRLTKMVIGAAIGVVILMLVNLVAGFFIPGGMGLRDGGALAIVFSLVCIAIGAFMLLLDFDQADQAVKAGVPARFAWYLAFGFMTTLVWLYIEILRLLSYFRE